MEKKIYEARADLRETGIAYSLATLLPAFLSLVVLVLLELAAEGYEDAEWYLYLSFLLPQICLAATALVYFRRGKRTPREVYSPCKPRYFVLAFLVQFGLLCALSELNSLFLALLERIGYKPYMDEMLPSLAGWNLLPAILVIALLPALFEETLFRGILTGGMQRAGWGTAATVLISGALFSLFHHNPEQTIYQFVCGACFALLMLRAGSPFPTMAAHFLNNAAVLVFTSLGIDSFYAALPLWGYIVLVSAAGLVLAGSLVYLIFLDKKEGEKPKGVKEGKIFFLAAAVGIALCAVDWIAVLVERCL